MPKFFLGILCLALVSCASSGWVTTLKDGREITSRDFPRLNDDTGYYRCVDESGETIIFHEKQVASIVSQPRD